MPIKSVAERTELVSFPKIGDIRKGEPKSENGRVGRDLTYFRAAFVEGEEKAAEIYHEKYGDQPRDLDVLLPFPEIDRNWEYWQEEYTASQLLHRCDGETCVLWWDKEHKAYRTDPKPCPGGCVTTGRLKVLLPTLRRLAYVTVHTTAINDILEITSNLNALKRLTGNGVNGIPLVLKRRPREVSVTIKGKRSRKKMWLLSIEAEQTWVDRQYAALEAHAMPDVPRIEAHAGPPASAGPDWDAYAPLEPEIVEDPELEGPPTVEEPPEPPSNGSDYVPSDQPLADWTGFFREAIRLGYENHEEVTATLRDVLGDDYAKLPETALIQTLRDHLVAPAAEQAELSI